MSGLEWLINRKLFSPYFMFMLRIERVQVITLDGRVIVGTLRGYDQNVNVVLVDAQERVFSVDMAVDVVPLGVQILRGDNV